MSERHSGRRPRHGTAEIELLLSVIVLTTILMLSVGAMRIALARLDASRTAQFEAFRDATSAPAPMYMGDPRLPVIEGLNNVRPRLPNRTHVARPTLDVSVNDGNGNVLPNVTVGGRAAMISPAWSYSSYPDASGDRESIAQWFNAYITESHGHLAAPLRLAPAWEP